MKKENRLFMLSVKLRNFLSSSWSFPAWCSALLYLKQTDKCPIQCDIFIECRHICYNFSLSHKINFVTLCFCPFYQKKFFFFFFEKPRNFMFLCVLEPGDHFTKSRPASCGQNFNQEKFRFQMISKPFDRSTSYLVWW